MKTLSKSYLNYFTVIFFLLTCFFVKIAYSSVLSNGYSDGTFDNSNNQPPVANNDTFIVLIGCQNTISLKGNVLANDTDPDGDEIMVYFGISPRNKFFQIDKNGEFYLTLRDASCDTLEFEYYISENTEDNYHALGKVTVCLLDDNDCDNIADIYDFDNDDDGILDSDEGDIDTDNDGIANYIDIDSDNDGITDNQEWQLEGSYVSASGKDINQNGWDDAYDTFMKGKYYGAVDTNNDGIPDYLDIDSDDDGVDDMVEGYDLDNDGSCDIVLENRDSDKDGLDDAFDIVACWKDGSNTSGSSSPLPDSNRNGIRDWRDIGENNIDIVLYPNPVRETIFVRTNSNQFEATFSLYSINGSLLVERPISNWDNSVDVSSYKRGAYIAKIHLGTLSKSKSVIITD